MKVFFLVRIISGLSGFLWAILLARFLSIDDFARYAAITSAVAVAGLVASLGLDRLIYRYVPAAHLRADGRFVVRLGASVLCSRLLISPMVTVAFIAFGVLGQHAADRPSQTLGLAFLLAATLAFSGVFNDMANALLCYERQARINLFNLLLRLAVAWVLHAFEGQLSLVEALTVMLVTEWLQILCGACWCLVPALRGIAASSGQAVGEPAPSMAQVFKLALGNYAFYMLALPWQGSTLRLLVASTSSAAMTALFGLVQTIADRLKQYLPFQLLKNATEPHLVRQYTLDRDVLRLNRSIDLIRRLDFLVLTVLATLAAVLGSELIAQVTAGKYLTAGPYAAATLMVLALAGITSAIWVQANTVGTIHHLSIGYGLVTAVLLLPMWWAASRHGPAGVLAVAALPSPLVWCYMWWRVGADALRGLWSVSRDLGLLLSAACAVLVGRWTLSAMGLSWHGMALAAVATTLALAGLGWLTRSVRSQDLLDLRVLLKARHAA